MRKIRLLISLSLVLFCVHQISAQRHSYGHRKQKPTVYMVAFEQVDTVNCPIQQTIAQNNLAAQSVRADFAETHRRGFQQLHNPQFVFTTKNNRFSLGIGGEINLRASYDLKGAVDNIDFVPYDIPMDATFANRQRIMMDATASRLFTKAVVNSDVLGRVVAYVDMDFRGGEEFSYIPHLRSAYVSMLGFTAGRDVTTFCDLEAVPETIDHEGPNAYNFRFATLLRYEVDFWRNHFTFGVAAEMPVVSGTYNDNFLPLAQRVPDVPVYLQYAWGRNRQSHFRASAVFRNMYLHNARTGNNTSLFGWGVQASAHIELGEFFTIYGNGIYGEGITPYIQDLTGSGLDFTPDPMNPEKIQTMPMWAWQASGQLNIIPSRFWISGGYSTAYVERENGYYSENQYRRGTYIYGNAFFQATANCRIAAEYLHGSRKNRNGAMGEANRLSLMVQYSF
ncbi:MAG: porin [Alistipes sp.]|nr:porin [Alistipes sp.]